MWKSHRFMCISIRAVDCPKTTIQDACHAEHGDGNRNRMESAPGRKGHRPESQGVETLGKTRKSVRGGLQPGRSREGSAGRPPAQGCQGRRSRTGPCGPDRFQRTRHHWARHRPGAPPPPGGRGSRTGTGNGVPGPTGRSGAVGHRNGETVGLSPDGGSWLSQVRSAGRRVGGTGSERSPSGHRS